MLPPCSGLVLFRDSGRSYATGNCLSFFSISRSSR